MEKQTIYPVCPHRNVAAAFECFFGPDSRSLDRFFQGRHVHRAEKALALVRAQGRRACAGAARELRRGALVISKAVEDLNLVLVLGWMAATYALSALAGASKFLLYQASVVTRSYPRSAFALASAFSRHIGQARL